MCLAAVGLSGILAYLFYDSLVAVTALLPLGAVCLHEWREEYCGKKELEFRSQFQNSIQILASLLKAGYSVENALRETEKELKPLYLPESRIRKEYERMSRELDMNLPVEQVLDHFAKRVRQEDVENFVIVFATAKRMGGDSIGILGDTVRMIAGKIETEREIETILASKKLEFRMMCLIPLGMVFYMRLAFPEFLSVLYGNFTGGVLMSVCLGVYVSAYRIGNRIIRIIV